MQTKLVPAETDDETTADLGGAVDTDGETVAVGPGTHSGEITNGTVTVFERTDGSWTGTATLSPAETIEYKFGYAVGVDGDTVVVGAPYNEAKPAAVYVFERGGGTWRQVARRTVGTGDSNTWLGASVAVAGETALVGAVQEDQPNGLKSGAAYVFERGDGSWPQRAKLVPSDGDEYDEFGMAVALADGVAVVGAWKDETEYASTTVGSAYVFRRTDDGWSQQAKLEAADAAGFDTFGSSIAISGDRILVGSPFDSETNGDYAGAAYLFERGDGSWPQRAKLTPTDGDPEDWFGTGVAIDGDIAVVGAKQDEDPNGKHAGSAYVFASGDSGWTQRAKFAPEDGESNDRFGEALAMSGRTAFVGADGHAGPLGNSGTTYVYDL